MVRKKIRKKRKKATKTRRAGGLAKKAKRGNLGKTFKAPKRARYLKKALTKGGSLPDIDLKDIFTKEKGYSGYSWMN